jgi:hypothetical protein
MSYSVNSTGYSSSSLAKNDNGVLNDLSILETMVAPTANRGIAINQYSIVAGADATRVFTIGSSIITNADGL